MRKYLRLLTLLLALTPAVAVSAHAESWSPEKKWAVSESARPESAFSQAQNVLENKNAVQALSSGKPFPNDPRYLEQWGVRKIGLDASVWSRYQGRGITIGVVDTGIDWAHADISSNIWTNERERAGKPGVDDDGNGFVDDIRGWDFVDSDNNPQDEHGHGTHVAGLIAAVGNNKQGIIGAAPKSKVIPVRVLNSSAAGSVDALAKGIEYAARAGARIINLSVGGIFDSANTVLLQKAIDHARKLGSIIIAAAGNSSSSVDELSPANLKGVIAVAATDRNDVRTPSSNFGRSLFLMAPGSDMLSLALGGGYRTLSGTSMAAAMVSGAVALLLEKYPHASLDFIKNRLVSGAKDLGKPGRDSYYGFGRLDIAASLHLQSKGKHNGHHAKDPRRLDGCRRGRHHSQ
jgi:subtilisin family serine protease